MGAMLAHLGAMLAHLEAYMGPCWPILPRRPIQWGKDFFWPSKIYGFKCLFLWICQGAWLGIWSLFKTSLEKNVEWPKKVKIGKNGKIMKNHNRFRATVLGFLPQGTDSQLEPKLEPWQPWFIMILWSLLASFTAAGMNPHQDSPCGSGSWSTGCPGFCRISTAYYSILPSC